MEYALGILCVAWTLRELRALLHGVRSRVRADSVIELRRVERRPALLAPLGYDHSVWRL